MRTEDEMIRPATRERWRQWLANNHTRAAGVRVVYPKKRAGIPGPTYDDVVEEALCFGWIDSSARTIDDDFTSVHVGPRRAGSVWAASNKARVARLSAAGLMTEAGLAAVNRAHSDGSWTALDRMEQLLVPEDLAEEFERHPGSRDQFEQFPASLRKMTLHWIYSAKRPATRARRVEVTASRSQQGLRPDFRSADRQG